MSRQRIHWSSISKIQPTGKWSMSFFNQGLLFSRKKKANAPDRPGFSLYRNLQTLSREEAKQMVRANGGQVATSISQRVTDVVVGEKAGSKRKKAEEMGVAILTEQAFSFLDR